MTSWEILEESPTQFETMSFSVASVLEICSVTLFLQLWKQVGKKLRRWRTNVKATYENEAMRKEML